MLRILSIFLFAAVGLIAVQSISQDFVYGRLVYGGKAVERHKKSNVPAEKLLATKAGHDVYGICRSDILRPVLSLHLLFLTKLNKVTDFEKWAGEVAEVQKFLRHMASCSPYDANVWVRYALISQSVAEEPAEIAGLLKASYRLGPNEYGQVMARLQVLRNASTRTQELADEVLNGDLHSALEYGNLDVVQLAGSGRTRYFADAYAKQRKTVAPARDAALRKKKIEYKPSAIMIE